jgi:hypothetical protein
MRNRLRNTARNNPAAEETGKNCDQKQSGSVCFLASTKGGSAERECTIPAGKAVPWVPINIECSYAEFPNLKTDEVRITSELRASAKSD